jgi:flagellar L-ring protein precursor FlgH
LGALTGISSVFLVGTSIAVNELMPRMETGMPGKRKAITGWLLLAALAGGLSACSTVPDTAIKQPFTARPRIDSGPAANNGGIFRPGRGLALFEDRRARFVGDILTVNLVERSSVSRGSESSDNRSGGLEVNVPVPTVFGNTVSKLANSVSTDSSAVSSFKDKDTNTNTITGTLTVTVVDILENGNLVVSGEKRISVNNDTEYIRLAGVVNPMHVSANNVVDSTRLSDVQIESKNSQSLDSSQMVSLMTRFFLTLVPF